MRYPYILYFVDTETTSLDFQEGEIVEISILRLNDEQQRTWCIKPEKPENISPDALRVNGHKIEDLLHKTAFGQETYKPLNKVLPEIENFFMDDGEDAAGRIMVAQNTTFDLDFIRDLWKKSDSIEMFPFGNRPKTMDTIQIQILLDILNGERTQYFNLGSLVEKYKVKKEKSHKADTDTRMCKEVFLKQLDAIKKLK